MSSRLPGRIRLFTAATTLSLLTAACLPHCFGNSAKLDTAPAANAKQASSQNNKYRLPKNAIPSNYELSFEPNLSKFTFTGSESVKLQIMSATKEIEMNALELKISAAQIIPADAASGTSSARDLEIKLEPETQKVRFIAKEPIAPGTYELKCKFEGTLNNQLRGFYRSGYTDESHNKAWLAATQMEPTDARRMFPAFDEPAYKAVFHIKAIINKNFVAISNAPVEHEETTADKKIVTFEPSPKMSTYLMALVIGDLKCTGETRGANVPIRVWAVSGKEHLGKYALSEAGKILDFQAKYFGVPYLGKKLDLIALPEFSAGAMENIGAITYHDSELLLDEKTGSSFQKESIFGTTAHEMAHQWFGDLVTMAWWDDLWLNESFATWMCTKVEDALHPEWRTMTE
ncbi:MAG: M1 family metallopeptidase, partial [Candidatus Obscuribacterales bacterium]|nr:M1 family metallopeptidase [Candidatus Obscuribacterales bacterium]